MKKILLPLLLLTLAFSLVACKKEEPVQNEDRQGKERLQNFFENRREDREDQNEEIDAEDEDEDIDEEEPVDDDEAEADTAHYDWAAYGISFDYASRLSVALATWGPFIAIGEGLTIYPETDNPHVLLMGIQGSTDADANISSWMDSGLATLEEVTINGNTYQALSYHNEMADVDTTTYYYEMEDDVFYLRVSETSKTDGDVILESLVFDEND
ncbi:MAG: hypothetical protein AAB802_04095 [Patescibacteria group bacterium]